MREISREILKIGEHILIDGIEYVVKLGGCDDVPCELVDKDEDDCDFDFVCRYNTHLEKK